MKKELTDNIEKSLNGKITNFTFVQSGTDEESDCLEVIRKEVAMLQAEDKLRLEEEKLSNDQKINGENLALKKAESKVNKERADKDFEHKVFIDKSNKERADKEFEHKVSIDESNKERAGKELEHKIAMDKAELEFREREMNFREVQLDLQKTQNKLQFWTIVISLAGIVSTFIIGGIKAIGSICLAKRAQDHEYKDYAMEPKSSVEHRGLLNK